MIKPYSFFYRKARNTVSILYTLIIRHRFKKLDSNILPNIEITNPEFISIGKNTLIRPYCWIYAIINDDTGNSFSPELFIGEDCSIGRFAHITCSNRVVIESKVMITEGVLITDSLHGYLDVSKPIIEQQLISIGEVRIGEGSWIGNGAKIIGNVIIGKNCLVSANSVVSNMEVPDYSVVAGIPGKIVKHFDKVTNEWCKIK
jgi:acetyltransferase-like isoleucine patch superfamily enzyme